MELIVSLVTCGVVEPSCDALASYGGMGRGNPSQNDDVTVISRDDEPASCNEVLGACRW